MHGHDIHLSEECSDYLSLALSSELISCAMVRISFALINPTLVSLFWSESECTKRSVVDAPVWPVSKGKEESQIRRPLGTSQVGQYPSLVARGIIPIRGS